ncbi:MAG: 2,4-dihydroxyhept-2-ene-1,7-dioic acid aldolase [Sphingobacteriaceae bacterium]|nr:2,4-dihydroxyhept-2-ene-1,7-dioic acid aldolase [Sphingobacteriaceae bacterium]
MDKKMTLGTWITIGHFSIAEILADAGFDWLCIDIEHSVIDYLELAQMISAIQGKNCKAFVRVGENNRRIIKRVLDAGADGLIIPSVNCLTDAVNAVKYVKYPPVGERGVGLARAQGYGFGFENYRDEKAKSITLIAQIEHVNAINELDDIISLDGIDGTFIGPYDLSGSMGKPGQYDDPDVKDALMRYETIAKKYNKQIGFHVIQPDYKLVAEKIDAGYNFIAFSLDSLFLGTIARQQIEHIRKYK